MKTIKSLEISVVLAVFLSFSHAFAAENEQKATDSFIERAKGSDNNKKEIIHIDNQIDESIKESKIKQEKTEQEKNNKQSDKNKDPEVKVNSPLYWNLGLGFDMDFLQVEGHRPAQNDFYSNTFVSMPGFSISLGAGNVVFSFKQWVLTVETVLMFNHTHVEKNPSPFTDGGAGAVGTNQVRDLFERSPFTADALVGFLSPPIIADKYSVKGFFGTSITQFSYSVASIGTAGGSGSPMSNGDVFGSGVGIGFKFGAGMLMPLKDFFSGGEMFAGLATCDVTYFPSAQVAINTTYRRLKTNFALHCGVAMQFGGTVVENK